MRHVPSTGGQLYALFFNKVKKPEKSCHGHQDVSFGKCQEQGSRGKSTSHRLAIHQQGLVLSKSKKGRFLVELLIG